jgi:hypothetical protein
MGQEPSSGAPESDVFSMNIVGVLSTEQQQLLTSMANLGSEFGRIQQIDDYFSQLLFRFEVSDSDRILLAMLCRAAHRQFYMALSQYLRTEIAEAMNSLRHCIESCLHVSHMCKTPADIQGFRNRDSDAYKKVYAHIKQFVKDNSQGFAKEQGLVALHELASRTASHSSYEWFARRIDFDDPENLQLKYFEAPENHHEFLWYYYFFLATFSNVINFSHVPSRGNQLK